MTVQSSLSTALDAYIQSNFTGTLDQVSASKLNLSSLLQIQRSLSSVLPNGILINGVANFYTATKPTTRVDGSALVIGDVWYDTTNNIWWFWNGTYWLSDLLISVPYSTTSGTGTISGTFYSNNPTFNLFVEKVYWSGVTGATNNASNYRVLNLWAFNNGNTNTVVNFATTAAVAVSTNFSITSNLNFLISTDKGYNFIQSTSVGAPTAFFGESASIFYRLAVK